MKFGITFTWLTVLATAGALYWLIVEPSRPQLTVATGEAPRAAAGKNLSPADRRTVRRVIESRCTVCHGCYDAPCQLKLEAYQGLLRGGTKERVYNPARMTNVRPTRLFIDAHSEKGWRDLGFHSVLSTEGRQSVISAMLSLKQDFNVGNGEPLPTDFPLALDRELACPAPSEIDKFRQRYPARGMPYGMATLSTTDLRTLQSWQDAGFPNYMPPGEVPRELLAQIGRWEAFLNDKSPEQQLVSRYLYEHLFLGHLRFGQGDQAVYYRLVRSSTNTGHPVRELTTAHPNDPPGTKRFYYRFRRLNETLLDKTHFEYPLDDQELRETKSLFFSQEWQVDRLPGYTAKEAGNPFQVFAPIPARARYQFLLNNALYFLSNFIKGPVCRGQVALNVINDYFHVAFLHPDYDLSIVERDYLEEASEKLNTTDKQADLASLPENWFKRFNAHRAFLELRDKRYREHEKTARGMPLEAIWNGSGKPGLLTVFRNFDSATVLPGLVGTGPQTMWVIDYPVFERIFYTLVVNFDVFGNASHQILTRLYMDHLRLESEGLLLSFLPIEARLPLLKGWYRGMLAEAKTFWAHSQVMVSVPARTGLQGPDYLGEFAAQLRALSAHAGDRKDSLPAALEGIDESVSAGNDWIRYLPELGYLLVYEKEQLVNVYSMLRNKAHANVSFMFGEQERRLPEEDSMTILPAIVGSYPNFFFRVEADSMAEFVSDLRSVNTGQDFGRFVERYGIRRTDSRFWATLDQLHETLERQRGVRVLLDVNRYENF